MISSKFLKSLKILEEMFEYRNMFEPSLYKKAHDELKAYLQEGEYESELNKEDKVMDFGKIRIFFNLNEKWDVTHLSQKKKMDIEKKSENIDHFIFVLTKFNTTQNIGKPSTLSKFIKDHLKKQIEIFHINELQYNVTKHILVPYHEVIRKEEDKDKLVKTYNIASITQFPLILNTDPVVRFIGGRENDLIKVIRKTKVSGEHTLYRFCVENR